MTILARRSNSPRLSDKAQREIESSFANQDEAFTLLALINAEFQSDPLSVQCFDLRIVQRVRECVEKRKRYIESNPWMQP